MTWPEPLPLFDRRAACPRCMKPWPVIKECLGWELSACWQFPAHFHASCPSCSREADFADPDPHRQVLARQRHNRLIVRRARQKRVFIRAFLCDAEGIIERLGPLPRGAGRGILTAWVWKHRVAVRDLSELLASAARVDLEMEPHVGRSSLCQFSEAPTAGRRGRR